MNKRLKSELLKLYKEGGFERVGFILGKTKIVEVPNISGDPKTSFVVQGEDIIKYVFDGKTTATWHTHPAGSANLSNSDYDSFLNYPELKHIIIGNDGIRIYEVEDGTIIQSFVE